MNASIYSSNRLSIADWEPIVFPKYGRGQLLAFYMDDSADGLRQVVFVVAGFLGDSRDWYEAERLWNIRLERDGLSYFRTSECKSLTGEFYKLVFEHGPDRAREIANGLVGDLKHIIRSRSLYAYCFMGPLQIYRQVRSREFGQNCLREDPYIEAHEQIVFNIAKRAGQARVKQPIAFVFDEHSKASQLMNGWAELKRRLPATSPWIGSLTAMDDKQCAPIQIADLIANAAKRAAEKILADPSTHSLFDLEEWRSNLAWVAWWNEEYLQALIDTNEAPPQTDKMYIVGPAA